MVSIKGWIIGPQTWGVMHCMYNNAGKRERVGLESNLHDATNGQFKEQQDQKWGVFKRGIGRGAVEKTVTTYHCKWRQFL